MTGKVTEIVAQLLFPLPGSPDETAGEFLFQRSFFRLLFRKTKYDHVLSDILKKVLVVFQFPTFVYVGDVMCNLININEAVAFSFCSAARHHIPRISHH